MPSGKPKASPKVARISVTGSPPQRSCETKDSPKTPPHIRTPISDQRAGPHQYQLLAPQAAPARHKEQRDERQRRQRRPPLLVERIGAEQDEAIFFRDHGPAGAEAADRPAGAGLVAGHDPDRIRDAPLHEADAAPSPSSEDQQQRNDGRRDRGEQIGAQPSDDAAAAAAGADRAPPNGSGFSGADVSDVMAQRSTSAMRALYQFMNRLMPRLMVRNTAMMSAIASIAWPVWFSVVLAIDTMS